MMKSFLESLNYSSINEDSASEIRALQIQPTDRVLCISGSGARPLDLLTEQPASIVAIDFNPCQNFLLELKIASIRALEYQEYLEFMGMRTSDRRKEIFHELRNLLSEEARTYWDQSQSVIEKGVLYSGNWERYFRKLTWILKSVRPRLMHRLFQCADVPEQIILWQKKWNDLSWYLFLRVISARFIWRYAFGDPGFYRFVPADFSIYSYLNQKLSAAAANFLFRQSPFTMLLFTGKFVESQTLPLHLQQTHFQKIKSSLGKVQIVTESLGQFLNQSKKNCFEKYSLSDFSSYTNLQEYAGIWREILRTAAPGARVCERQFLVKRDIPLRFMPFLERDPKLEEELNRLDTSIFYSFIIARIKPKDEYEHIYRTIYNSGQ